MQVIAHRGATGRAPENTLAAFRLAADLGAQAIETDLRLTRDGHVVLMHDDTLQRTTSGRGPVTAKTLDELRELDAGSWFPRRFWRKHHVAPPFAGEPIPTIEELLDLACWRDIALYLEIKAPCPSGTELAVVQAIRDAGALARCTVISFEAAVLEHVRQSDPAVSTGYTFKRRQRDAVDRAVALGAKMILPRVNRVTPTLIAEAKRRGLRVVTWTVNDVERMKQLMALGMDGIMSDFPGRLAAVARGA
jgi:glycerophosphoryl diester phosphodiesterase